MSKLFYLFGTKIINDKIKNIKLNERNQYLEYQPYVMFGHGWEKKFSNLEKKTKTIKKKTSILSKIKSLTSKKSK